MAHGARDRRTQPRRRVALDHRSADGRARAGRGPGSILSEISERPITAGMLDVSFYRDDLSHNPVPAVVSRPTSTTTSPTERSSWSTTCCSPVERSARRSTRSRTGVVLGPSNSAVLVDRGHRELPIRPDFVGKNLPTSHRRGHRRHARRRLDRHRGRPRDRPPSVVRVCSRWTN